MNKPWILLLLAACAPVAEPGGHLAWKLQLEETPVAAECGDVFAARELEVELWAAYDGVQVLRFPSTEPIALGTSEVSVPHGLWTTNGVFSNADTLSLTLAANGDGGVLSLTSSPCCASVPFRQHRIAAVSSPLPDAENVVDGARPFTVAVQQLKPDCAVDVQKVNFEVWQLGEDALTLPGDVLRADGSQWRSDSLTVSAFIDALQNRGTLHVVDGGCDVSLGFFAVSR